jgi:hypothetical protein
MASLVNPDQEFKCSVVGFEDRKSSTSARVFAQRDPVGVLALVSGWRPFASVSRHTQAGSLVRIRWLVALFAFPGRAAELQ